LGFIDPFTGSGILAALLTGSLAGRAAARALSPDEYAAQCRRLLARQYRVSAALRALVASGLAGSLAAFIPSSRLYRFTRPSA
jgi:flavin-dependent dehydrogenase